MEKVLTNSKGWESIDVEFQIKKPTTKVLAIECTQNEVMHDLFLVDVSCVGKESISLDELFKLTRKEQKKIFKSKNLVTHSSNAAKVLRQVGKTLLCYGKLPILVNQTEINGQTYNQLAKKHFVKISSLRVQGKIGKASESIETLNLKLSKIKETLREKGLQIIRTRVKSTQGKLHELQ